MRSLLVLLLCAGAACASDDDGRDGAVDAAVTGDGGTRDAGDATPPSDAARDATDAGPRPPSTLGTDRPARLVVPPAHDGVTPLPLVFLLHGYTADSALQDLYFGMSAAARSRGFYLVLPDGTVDRSGSRFWNATDACCDLYGTGVDDVGYLTELLDEAERLLPVDDGRIYFVGHSNGGFMSYRMACEISDRVTAFASLAGSDYRLATSCVPSEGVSALQIHGTNDGTISYDGTLGFPSAPEVVARWAERAGCDVDAAADGPPIDLDTGLVGSETTVRRYETACDPGLDAELWTIEGGSHIPSIDSATFGGVVADWLLAHQKS